MAASYDLKKTANGKFMFNLKAGNGEIERLPALAADLRRPPLTALHQLPVSSCVPPNAVGGQRIDPPFASAVWS